ncbi:alpha/beta hydrolase family protein [Dawidia soli]|uniref:Alpha/beta fold hydrolase n=1 Tax=Dawidia soli TaxID=2782352 RepID=A0AAP2D5I3_9BACT|nr:alpha/beta fold hydrolase [Dawidia soli]MBT1685749.1 alpha/beta fold hydrolase [Dawidia soli]
MASRVYTPVAGTVVISPGAGSVSVRTIIPPDMAALLVLGHGAGAGMLHGFMESLAHALADHGIGTVRYNFLYMEQGRKLPDKAPLAAETVARVVDYAHAQHPGVPLLAGGKSFGGRMTSHYAAAEAPAFLRGIVFYGFPLHPPKKPDTSRADHLPAVTLPMLFLQGTRDTLAEWPLIEAVCKTLPAATLVKIEGADHAFAAGKKDVISILAAETRRWFDGL